MLHTASCEQGDRRSPFKVDKTGFPANPALVLSLTNDTTPLSSKQVWLPAPCLVIALSELWFGAWWGRNRLTPGLGIGWRS